MNCDGVKRWPFRVSETSAGGAARQRVQSHLTNLDGATEEFDSHDLRVEKLVTPGGKVSFWIGPLKPGAYAFMGEFHAATAKGRVVAVKP